jgi:hypothetical protein
LSKWRFDGLISMFNMITFMKKEVLVRGVDQDVYKMAKSAAALRGVSMGAAVSDALRSWVNDERKEDEIEKEAKQNVQYVKTHWGELKKHQGKVVVISGRKLRAVFSSYEEARDYAGRFRLALTFKVDELPRRREVELGPELEIQQ